MSALYPTRDRHFTKATERRLSDDARKHVYGASGTSLLVQHSYPELLNNNANGSSSSNNYQQSSHSSSKGSPSHHNNQHVWTSIGIKKYQIIKKVGSGTYGWVFHAKSPQGTYDVAIKQLSPMQNEKTLQDGFHITAIREIKILKSLQHTNIISLHDVICDKENVMDSMDDTNRKKDKAHKNIPSRMQTYMIFEYMHHDLSGLLHNDAFTSTFNIRHIKYFLCQILNALEYCHETALILHRDIKSSNLLVDNHGVVKIADFGLARQFIPELSTCNKKIAVRHESINRSSVQYPRQYTNRVVTLWYRAPELLLSDQHYTPSVDLWSVGCVFAEMLFNKPIFCGKNELEQWFQIIECCGWDQKQEEKWIKHLRDKDGLVNAMRKKSKTFNRKLKKKFNQFLKKNDPSNTKYLDENGFNLLDSLLTINPFKRCSAKRARLNEWFKSSPFPTPPQLSHIAPSHDYEQRQARKNPNYKKNQNGYNNSQSNNQRRYQYNPYGNGNNGGYGNRNNNGYSNNNVSNRYNTNNSYNNSNNNNNNYNNNNNNHYRRNSMGNNNSNDKNGPRSRSRSRSRERGGSNAKSQRNKPLIDDRSRSGSFDKTKKDNSTSLPPPLAFKPPIATKPNNGKMVVTLTAPTMNRPTTVINVPKPQNGMNNSLNKVPSYNNQNSNGYKKPYIQYQKPFDPNEPTTFYSRHKRPDNLKGRSRF